MMNSNDNQQKSDDGLPEVSQKITRKKSVVVVMVGAILMVIFSIWFQTKTAEKSDKPIEETYSVQSELDNKTVIPIAPLAVNEPPKESVPEK